MRKASFVSLIVIMGLLLPWTPASAQDSGPPSSSVSIKRTVATVVLCGLGGAVIGLSTLSFYSDPQERISNITTGFALGLLGGSVYVVSRSTQNPSRDYSHQNSPFKDLDQMQLRAGIPRKEILPLRIAHFEF